MVASRKNVWLLLGLCYTDRSINTLKSWQCGTRYWLKKSTWTNKILLLEWPLDVPEDAAHNEILRMNAAPNAVEASDQKTTGTCTTSKVSSATTVTRSYSPPKRCDHWFRRFWNRWFIDFRSNMFQNKIYISIWSAVCFDHLTLPHFS
jgi:hypothetical protein